MLPTVRIALGPRGLKSNFVPNLPAAQVDEIAKMASEKPQERFLQDVFDPQAPNVFHE